MNQHRPAFVPVTKHRPNELASPAGSRTNPPNSPGLASPSSDRLATAESAVPQFSPLRPLAYENVPLQTARTLPPASPNLNYRNNASVKDSIVGSSPAPKIRAKLTPAATPRRKAVDGIYPVRAAAWPNRLTDMPEKISAAESSVFTSPIVASPARFTPVADQSPFSESSAAPESVVVCVRVRPPTTSRTREPVESPWSIDEHQSAIALASGGLSCNFDSIVTSSENDQVYLRAGRNLVLDAMEGFDAVVFAYGQTASGKTFTLAGDGANPGLIPLSISEIFSYIEQHAEREFLLRVSYMEIYNETLRDLLNPSTAVRIRQDKQKRFFASPLQEEVVTTEAQVHELIQRGAAARQVGQTDYNARSSRSHSVFQVTIESRDDALGGSGAVRTSRLSLIDLAGSESATSQLERRAEGAFINKSLLTLEKVIASLTSENKHLSHVPFRDSKLTQILQPSLSGDARVVVIATVNPSAEMVEETKSTLRFAQRVKKVVLKAARHEVVNDKALISQYRSHIAALEAQLAATSLAGAKQEKEEPAVDAQRVLDLERQVEEFRSLFLTSKNLESRRKSALPARPVSPSKVALGSESSAELDPQDRLEDALDEIEMLTSERDALRVRVAELEQDRLKLVEEQARAGESELERRVAELMKENQELHVVLRNSDAETLLQRQEKQHLRQLDKCRVYSRSLEDLLAEERQRVAQFERFVLQSLSTQASMLAAAAVAPELDLHREGSLSAVGSPVFVELDSLPFSEAGRDTLRRSARARGLGLP